MPIGIESRDRGDEIVEKEDESLNAGERALNGLQQIKQEVRDLEDYITLLSDHDEFIELSDVKRHTDGIIDTINRLIDGVEK